MKKLKQIAIYGTGVDGRRLHRILRKRKNINIKCFLDEGIKKKKIFFKTPVYNPRKNLNILNEINEIYLGGRYMDLQNKSLIKMKYSGKIIRTNRWNFKYSQNDVRLREKVIIKILKKLVNIFDENKINYFIDGSSLLAIGRKQNLSDFSDVDIAVIEEKNELKKLMKINLDCNKKILFYKSKHFLFKQNSFKQMVLTSKCNSYNREPAVIEFYKEFEFKKNYFRFVPPSLVSKVPNKFRTEFEYIEYNSLRLRVPKNFKLYLEYLYGKSWRNPSGNWKNTDKKYRFSFLKNF